MKSEWLARILMVSVSLLLGLGVLEITARLIEPKKVLRSYFEAPDQVLDHRFIPGTSGHWKTPEINAFYSINSLGLRDREITKEKPPGVGRVLMIGDSFTEGNGVEVEDAFPARVQKLVDGAGLKKKWQVINAGEGSYSPVLEYLKLKQIGFDLQPDLVILNFDPSDVYDDIEYTSHATFDSSGDVVAVPAEPERKPGPFYVEAAYAVKDFVKEHTRLYNMLRRHLYIYFAPKPDTSGDVRVDKYASLRDTYKGNPDKDYALTYRYLERIRDALAARGIPLWVGLYPMGVQVSEREWEGGRPWWGFQPGKIYPTAMQDHVAAFCRSKGIPVVDTTPAILEHEPKDFPLYFKNDGHWLPAGHAIAAGVFFRELLPFLKAHEPADVQQVSDP